MCFTKDASNRPTAEELLQSAWMQRVTEANSERTKESELDLGANLAVFAKASAFQSGVCSILANLATEAEDLRDLNKLFVQWDTNQDGSLSLQELQTNMKSITQFFNLDEPDVRRMMQAADTNNDGTIDYTEFITAAFDKKKLLSQENIRRAFNMLDADEDGAISTSELQEVFQGQVSAHSSTQFWQDIMNQVDANKDGFISYDEF